ncbi:MAG TPA: hypothetical protein VGK10_16015, partial [Prolixibacteraceae bacterium]
MKKTTIGLYLLFTLNFSITACAQGSKNDILVSKDLEYRQATDYLGKIQPLKLDVYQPSKEKKAKLPVILLVHGGGFASGDKGYTAAQGNFYPEMANT